jgi:hypothetical protein
VAAVTPLAMLPGAMVGWARRIPDERTKVERQQVVLSDRAVPVVNWLCKRESLMQTLLQGRIGSWHVRSKGSAANRLSIVSDLDVKNSSGPRWLQ